MRRIVVAAGVIRRGDGRVLVARRPRGKHMAGAWEFPGGKVRPDETPRRTLNRELHEELGIIVRRSAELMNYEQEYPDRLVELHFFAVEDYRGKPDGREGQELAWEFPGNLGGMGFLPADRPLVELLIQQTASIKGKSAR